MTAEGDPRIGHAHSVLIVDSDHSFTVRGSRMIAEEGYRAWGAEDLIAAANFLTDHRPDLMVVELDLLQIDHGDPLGDIQARAPGAPILIGGDGPPDDRLAALEQTHRVYGYHDKGHGMEGLRLWVRAALTAARNAQLLSRTRRGLRQVLSAIPELHRIQSPEQTLETIQAEMAKLLGAKQSFVAARVSDPVGKPETELLSPAPPSIDDYRIGAADDSSYPVGSTLDLLESVPEHVLRRALEARSNVIDNRHGVLSFALAKHVLGLAYLDQPGPGERDTDLLQLFSSHAAAAIRTAALYELATIDSTTRVYRKAFALERLLETLKLAWRKLFPVTVLMIDIDRFKEINDVHGHVVGDRVLRYIGQLLKAGVRDSDIVGRFGGDEFVVVLIDANRSGANIVAERLHEMLVERSGLAWPAGLPEPGVSIGRVSLEPDEDWPARAGFPDFQAVVDHLVSAADAAMYRARREERGLFASSTLTWSYFVD